MDSTRHKRASCFSISVQWLRAHHSRRSPNHNAPLAMKLLIAFLLLTLSCHAADTIISPDMRGPKVPDSLLIAYHAFLEDAKTGDATKIRKHLLPHAAEITPLERVAPNREIGVDINLPFMKTAFSPLILATSLLSDEAFSLRTGTTNIRWVRVAPDRWLIYGYLDKPIE